MKIKISGHSDDIVDVEGCEGADEFYVAHVSDGSVCWHADLVAPGASEQLRVSAFIGDEGCWHVALGQPLESVPFPSWPVEFGQDKNGYSVMVTIDAPEGTRLTNVRPEKS